MQLVKGMERQIFIKKCFDMDIKKCFDMEYNILIICNIILIQGPYHLNC